MMERKKRMNDLMLTGGAMLPAGNGKDEERRGLLWLRLLQRQIEKYTHGESSSVPLETAGSLLRCILYTAALPPSDGAEGEKTPEALYEEGREILSRQFKKAQRLMYLVQSTMLPVDAPCYREAIEMGIPGFFRAYDMEFAAQETPGDFDYPASIPCAQTGITWMLHYLETLYWENVFCRRFPLKEVEGTLKAQGVWGVAIPVNVFEPVFAAALHGCLRKSGRTSSLAVHAAENGQLIESLAHLPRDIIFQRVKEAFKKLMEEMDVKSAFFRALLTHQADALARHLAPALKYGDVSGVFPPWESPPPPLLMMDGDPMEDEDFRALSNELASCRYFSDKLLLVRRRAHSLYDVTWLMECGCFMEQEMVRLFSVLGKEELAALMRMGRGGLKMQGRWIFPDAGVLPGDAPLWEKSLYGYLNGLGLKRRKEIVGIAGQMVT